MTEEEARKRWCPFARQGVYGDKGRQDTPIAVNRDPRYEPPHDAFLTPCLGSSCMAWRWDNTGPGTGYCGLAGPQPLTIEGVQRQ